MRFRQGASIIHLGYSLLAYLMSLLFKESVITFPVVLMAYEILLEVTGRVAGMPVLSARSKRLLGAYGLVLAAYAIVRWVTMTRLVDYYELAYLHLSWAVFPNLIATIARSFLPYVPLQLFPSQPKLGLSGAFLVVLGTTLAMAGIFSIVTTVRRPTKGRLAFIYLLTALCISTIPTLAARPSIIDSEGERFSYLPSVFASIALGLLIWRLGRTTKTRVAIGSVL
jgi:hypothetical protein